MATLIADAPSSVPVPTPRPTLEPGDHLSRDEFEYRYSLLPEVKKAELIEGIVYMPSPVRIDSHGKPHSRIVGWLLAYQAATPGTDTGDNATVRLDVDNEPQPDAMLYLLPDYGGQIRISADDYVENGPEWIGEIAASTASYDLHSKLNAYRRNKVREYLVVLPERREVRWHELRNGKYELLVADDGILRSRQFPGLWLHVQAMLDCDSAAILATLQQGIASPEHAAFVASLKARRD